MTREVGGSYAKEILVQGELRPLPSPLFILSGSLLVFPKAARCGLERRAGQGKT